MLYQASNAGVAALALLVPLTVLGLAALRGGLGRKLGALPPAGRVLAVFGLLALAGYGGDKPEPGVPVRVLELLTVLRDGTLTDRSGLAVSGVQARALQQFSEQSQQIADATAAVVEQARLDCIALTNQIAQADYSVAYLSLDMPRGTPTEPNHNIMVGLEKVTQTESNLTAWVWFSEMPATNVNVRVQYSVAEGQWAALDGVACGWPETELVNGVECVRYCYEVPSAIAGTPLRPQYEVEFGGFLAEEYLSVPATGVTVEVGEVTHLPYTGWATLGDGLDKIEVELVGGIAVQAVQHGTNYVGNCLLEGTP